MSYRISLAQREGRGYQWPSSVEVGVFDSPGEVQRFLARLDSPLAHLPGLNYLLTEAIRKAERDGLGQKVSPDGRVGVTALPVKVEVWEVAA